MNSRNYTEIFKKNFLTSVACEIRFTPLLIIKENIGQFQKEIRENFPKLRRGFIIPREFEMDEWVFMSKDSKDKLRTFTDRLSIITTSYNDFEPFYKMVSENIDKFFKSFKDIDKLTRIGLRYTNEISLNPNQPLEDILKWFNPLIYEEKIVNLTPFGFSIEFRMPIENNIITCRNNLTFDKSPKYIIDIDSYTEREVEISKFKSIFKELHELAIKEFHKNIKDEFLNILKGEEKSA